MFNQVFLVGRIAEDYSKDSSILTVEIKKNGTDNMFETSSVDVTTKGIISQSLSEYCKKGDIIGIKGTVQSIVEDNVKKNLIVANKITLISSKKED